MTPATTDGDRWLVEDIVDDPDEQRLGPNLVATNGAAVLVNTGAEWLSHDAS